MADDAHIQFNLHVDAAALTAATPMLAKMVASAVTAYNQRCAEMRGQAPAANPGHMTAEPGRVLLELPAEYADPNRCRIVRITKDPEWVEVLPGIEVRARQDMLAEAESAYLEFRFHPAGPASG